MRAPRTAGTCPASGLLLRSVAAGGSRFTAGWLALVGTSVTMTTALLLAGCGGSGRVALPTGKTIRGETPTTSALDGQILTAWRAAENAFYQAEASPRGLFSPVLSQTMVNPILLQIKRNLAGDEHSGYLGVGGWDLGAPVVVSILPSHSAASSAEVVSCIHDMQRLVDKQTRAPAPGELGEAGWVGATSQMVKTIQGWRLSNQSGVINSNRSVACSSLP